MPIYEAKCKHCGTVQTYRAPMNERELTPPCHQCNEETQRVMLTPPMGFVDRPAA